MAIQSPDPALPDATGSNPGDIDRSADQAVGRETGASRRRPIAVAVRQDGAGPSGKPRIVASGRGAVAEQILNIAFENGVRVREDADLAEILSAVEVDCEIPLEALAAVAEILSYVYRANGQQDPDEPEAKQQPETQR